MLLLVLACTPDPVDETTATPDGLPAADPAQCAACNP